MATGGFFLRQGVVRIEVGDVEVAVNARREARRKATGPFQARIREAPPFQQVIGEDTGPQYFVGDTEIRN